ncbi:MAG: DNA repair protein RadA [Planctomycetes bacterium]|jgi:DNA repair protein RadA/Sms|nr:DNA repair protein RadA [Planctomycetota bacterium]
MAEKIKTLYTCSNCDAQFPKWNGRCLECGAWGTLGAKTVDFKEAQKQELNKLVGANIIPLSEIKQIDLKRIETNIQEVDRVLGGGIVPGSLLLLGGEPGVGKSTLVAQIANAIGLQDKTVVYVSGEESASQVRSRLERLNCSLDKLQFIGETNIEKIASSLIKVKPDFVIIDSIQTIYSSLVVSETGNISQIRACAAKCLELAKQNNMSICLIGHITKDGQIAGPKSLEHIVDTVLYLENELNSNYSVLRAAKNRFGSVNEIGVFEMTGSGFKEVRNPSAIFLEEVSDKRAGSVIGCVMEGSRPFFVDVQALVTKTLFGYPQRKAAGFDLNRLQVLSAVISKRTKVNLTIQDIILNIAGGLKVNDPALDLAVCTAIISSLANIDINRDHLFLGEVGLGGEIRNIGRLEQRLIEAEKMGFKKAIIPKSKVLVKSKIKVETISHLSELQKLL